MWKRVAGVRRGPGGGGAGAPVARLRPLVVAAGRDLHRPDRRGVPGARRFPRHAGVRRAGAAPFDGNPKAVASLGISPRELVVLKELAAGRSNKVIARRLEVSPNTVKTHLARLYEKLGASGAPTRSTARESSDHRLIRRRDR